MTTPATETDAHVGTCQLDATHPTVASAVKYMGVTTFRSKFLDVAATVEDGTTTLVGTGQAASIDIDNEVHHPAGRVSALVGEPLIRSRRNPHTRSPSTSRKRQPHGLAQVL